ncbi:MAG: single-stranded-DNA-specific exonuclease RecJ [Aestuariivita sp.]|nr:single-stranded-DNA-specific exonuclease RecJ [Aestuariivita sp.]MCY4202387.1 single-stranded-DNA-specific exonuclease RecJ [Aestuariivita sp.]MCY4288674.1 single-stranded-DNA-specific exonuclease RecJ [Aestuariivita sp.]MCY4345555.1 single-stranded-DNA-specific exonuclease RecJ [Aestuariivita sp.]
MSFLGVNRSLNGNRWIGPDIEIERWAETLVQRCSLTWPLARVLARRNVAPQVAEQFLNPKLRDLLPDPLVLKDMRTAADRLLKALNSDQRIAIFADYDVDGAAGAALLIEWLRPMGKQATLYIPDRIREGYGPNAEAIASLAKTHELIICVDCGMTAHAALSAAAKADVIVLDHHQGDELLPPALAIVNPNRADEPDEFGYLCATAVVFLMLVDVGRLLRNLGIKSPDLMAMLDLVALATVADVSPLVGLNRALVRQGLKVMSRRRRLGLSALADVAGLGAAPTASHLGFQLGPRINAGGRIGTSTLGVRLLTSSDPAEAAAIALKLDQLNAERRDIELVIETTAVTQAEKRGVDGPLVWAAGEDWHQGVVGIVASRLREKTGRPAVVIGFNGKVGKGSARSLPGVNIGAAIVRLVHEGLLVGGGGHRMAAGLTVERKNLELAMARLAQLLRRQGSDRDASLDLRLDGLITPRAITFDLVSALNEAGPFGSAAPAPMFAVPDLKVKFAKPLGNGHVKLLFADSDEMTIDGIAFGVLDSELGQSLSQPDGTRYHVVAHPEINVWRGKHKVQLRIRDAARVAPH